MDQVKKELVINGLEKGRGSYIPADVLMFLAYIYARIWVIPLLAPKIVPLILEGLFLLRESPATNVCLRASHIPQLQMRVMRIMGTCELGLCLGLFPDSSLSAGLTGGAGLDMAVLHEL